MFSTDLDEQLITTIRMLSIDAIQKANSGHPGLPLGAAPMAYTLFSRHLKHDPSQPTWFNRDRFILSAGHGSMLLYSLLHLYGYNFSIDDIKNFRQLGSKTCGHPELEPELGIEMTTGPLGQGFASAVGIALAERHLASKFNEKDFPIIDHYTYTLVGDGCMMEGISSEAASIAGHLKLSKLICLYDDNKISIEGNVDCTFTDDVAARFESQNWQVLKVSNGNDINAISKALTEAKACDDKPSLIIVRTEIGYGSPKQGSESSHGAPLGLDAVAQTHKFYSWPEEHFYVPEEVSKTIPTRVNEAKKARLSWDDVFSAYSEKYPEKAKALKALISGENPNLYEDPSFFEFEDKAMATRSASGICLNRIAKVLPELIGGSADLGSSVKTILNGESYISSSDYSGRNLHFGVRELAMASVGNGLALHGLRPYVGTFFVFSDYLQGSLRESCIMNLPILYIFSHDSIGVGEDGPTHEPIEHLTGIRAMPNLTVIRPADARETAAAYAQAISSKKPTALILTRQDVPQIKGSAKNIEKGAYILEEKLQNNATEPELIIISCGSELHLCYETFEKLVAEGHSVRLVSMPSQELFLQTDASYQEKILPKQIRKRLAVEAGHRMSWYQFVGLDGKVIGIDRFGASGPAKELFKYFGFTTENIYKEAKELLSK